MGRLIKEKPLTFIWKSFLNILYGALIFLTLFFSSSVGRDLIPKEWYAAFSIGFIIIQSWKTARKNVPQIKKEEKNTTNDTIRT